LAQNFELFGCKIDKIETLIQFYLCDDSPKCGITFPASFELSTDDAVDASALHHVGFG
jgi:hypothetical protein